MFILSKKSLNNLVGVNSDLVRVVTIALSTSQIDFGIISGLRTIEEQTLLVKFGKSQTMSSKHLTGRAVDFFCYVNHLGTWEGRYYKEVSDVFKKVANDLKIPIIWGGDWNTFKDLDHIELKDI